MVTFAYYVMLCTVEDEDADAGRKSGLLVELVVVLVEAPVLLARLELDVAAGAPTALRKASCPTLDSNHFRLVS